MEDLTYLMLVASWPRISYKLSQRTHISLSICAKTVSPIMAIANIEYIAKPQDITLELLSEILSNKVASHDLKPLGKGAMSNVQILTIEYDKSINKNEELPIKFIVKFKKPEIPLPDLFSVEAEFYRLTESICNEPSSFPFQLVKAYAAGSSWLMLEFISHSGITTYDVHEGCPTSLFDELLVAMAKMHSYFWIYDEDQSANGTILKYHSQKLSATPGAGHSLPISERQKLFLPAWPAFRDRLSLYIKDSDSLQMMEGIVEWTAADDHIEKSAFLVSLRKWTIVHGDFHIGNLLVNKTTPWLVDWSMAGVGNPLVDLVFFLVVGAPNISTDGSDTATSANVERVLKLYHTTLNKQNPMLSWDQLVLNFRLCLLNQLIILVCYDELCRDMADSFQDERVVYHAHFDRVNVRCVKMLLSDFGWVDDMFR